MTTRETDRTLPTAGEIRTGRTDMLNSSQAPAAAKRRAAIADILIAYAFPVFPGFTRDIVIDGAGRGYTIRWVSDTLRTSSGDRIAVKCVVRHSGADRHYSATLHYAAMSTYGERVILGVGGPNNTVTQRSTFATWETSMSAKNVMLFTMCVGGLLGGGTRLPSSPVDMDLLVTYDPGAAGHLEWFISHSVEAAEYTAW